MIIIFLSMGVRHNDKLMNYANLSTIKPAEYAFSISVQHCTNLKLKITEPKLKSFTKESSRFYIESIFCDKSSI